MKTPNMEVHCRRQTKKSPNFDKMLKNDIIAFICEHCNYTQLNEVNVIKHLKSEHEIRHEHLQGDYTKILLLLKPGRKNLFFY